MRTFVLILLCICSFPAALFSQEFPESENDTIIVWTENRKLTYNDFVKVPLQGIKAAESNIGIEVRLSMTDNINLKFYVITYFYKKSSTISSKKPEILKHEQVHFDIAELFARKMRQRIQQLINANYRSARIKEEINKLYQDYANFQDRYDRETNHSINSDEQEKWNAYIGEEMDRLYAFRSKIYATK